MIEIRIDEVFATPLTNEEVAKQELETSRQGATAYLDNTDWYVTRKFERGIEIPLEVQIKRAEAVEVLN